MKEFLKRKNIEISLKRYGIDALGAMAQGLFCSLLIGTIIKTLGSQLGIGFLTDIGTYAMAVSGPAMAIAIGYALKADPMVLFSLAAVGWAANAEGGAGGPLAVLVIAIIAAEFGKAVWNTIRLTVIASIITALCGQFLGYITTRGRGKWYGGLTEQLVFIPYLMSGIAFSSMYVAMFSQPRLGGLLPSLYGTFTLIVLTSVVKHFPFASRSGTANMMQIAVELEEAAEINGAGFGKKLSRIVLPLAKNGFISGFMLTFISIAKELDLIIIMMDKRTTTMSYLAFTYSQDGMNQMSDAISVCVLLFILVCYIIANRFGADIGKSW